METSSDQRPGTAQPPDPCWICGSLQTTCLRRRSSGAQLTSQDLQITDHHYGDTLTLYRCGNCGFVFADRKEAEGLVELYENLSDQQYVQTQQTRLLQMRWLLKQAIGARPRARTLLDIGAASGLMVKEARQNGLQAQGIEPSRELVAVAQSAHGIQLIQGTFPHPNLAGASFDLIFLNDVIEHVLDPVSLLQSCLDALSAGGMLIVVTPDLSSLPAQLLGRRWWHFRRAHVGYFDRKSMNTAAAAAHGRVIGRQRAKWFFPISYLAERIQEYLPLRQLNRLAVRTPLRRFYELTVPINLHDSWVFFLEPAP